MIVHGFLNKGGGFMTNLDFILLQIYLLTLLSIVIKHKIHPLFFRTIKAFVLVLIVFALLNDFSQLSSRSWRDLLNLVSLLLIVIILVQADLKALLVMVGMKSGILISNAIEDEVKETIGDSIDVLSKKKIGAIITFERSDTLQDYIDSAFQIEAKVSAELLGSIFMPNTPLHDGAVIISENTIRCAGAYFPPSESPKIPKYLGSRHRAAIGISEKTDAFTIIVSEETGAISVAIDGYLDQDISNESLLLYLEKYLQN